MTIKPHYQVTQEKQPQGAQPPMQFLSPSQASKAGAATSGFNGHSSWFLLSFCSLCLPRDLLKYCPTETSMPSPLPPHPRWIIHNVIMGILLELIPDSFKCPMRLSCLLKPGTLSWQCYFLIFSSRQRSHIVYCLRQGTSIWNQR